MRQLPFPTPDVEGEYERVAFVLEQGCYAARFQSR